MSSLASTTIFSSSAVPAACAEESVKIHTIDPQRIRKICLKKRLSQRGLDGLDRDGKSIKSSGREKTKMDKALILKPPKDFWRKALQDCP
jgi:hypothetical protein